MTGGCIHLLVYFNNYNKNLVINHHNSFTVSNSTYESLGGGTSLCGLQGDVPLNRVLFYDLSAINRVYNFRQVCPKQGLNLS